MKRILAVCSLISLLAASGQLFAVEYNVYSALIYVYDHNGDPLAGIPVSLFVKTWYGDEWDPEYYNCQEYGSTDSYGSAYLSCWIPTQYSEGLYLMRAGMTDQNYTVISSQNTSTTTAMQIYPVFNIGIDSDGNGIFDDWEMPLAQKFCPYLILHSDDNGVRPVPVESMDRNGDGQLGWEDVLVTVYSFAPEPNGDPVGEFGLDEILIHADDGQYLMSIRYPHLKPAYLEQAEPIYNPISLYYLLPHFEWGNVGSTNPSSWYSSWSAFIQEHSSESAYTNGTTYAHLFSQGNHTVIQYWFFYPFNASANRHEGDWEHINVVLDTSDPNIANIIRVEYYFHEAVTSRATAGVDYYLTGGAHPVVFVGGYTNFYGYSGHGTHGSYPFDDWWPDINPLDSDEFVDGLGLHIDFANYQNIVILPAVESIEVGGPLDWMTYAGFWGHIMSSPTAGDGIEYDLFNLAVLTSPALFGPTWLHILTIVAYDVFVGIGIDKRDDTRMAPFGPAAKKNTWNKTYEQTGLSVYTKR